jgi:dienelactone hydrolase
MKKLLFVLLLLSFASCSMFSTKTTKVVYKVDGVDHHGYIASGAKKGEKKKAVIIVHEWWGHNDYARSRADKLAEEGYVAMSIDMYGEGKTAGHPKEAGAFAKKTMSNMKLARKKFEKALKVLKARKDVDTSKIAAIGYCFGGGVVLNMARAGVDLDLVASFHGSLMSPIKARKGKIKPRVLVFNGAADPMVKSSHIKKFKKDMKRAGVKYTFKNYPNALHAFTNKGADALGKKYKLPLGYNKHADEDSWKVFLKSLKDL